ncbi:acyl-CoA thioesterase [Actinotalea subterranea]|uniref:acyl-CoA thioesterase n=1 Tax=Actinotalea subterranea TaxID=2607497 RepID=UPI0011ECC59E|nr:acyl-CoA thioesterase [Actinotalea subterranea]
MTRQIQLALAATFPRRPVPGRGLLDVSVTALRVTPADLDLYLHVNNGVYLQMMDVARTNLLADLGALPTLRTERWYPVVAASTVKYRRSLRLGERFEIASRVLGWDERVVYLEQVFTRGGHLVARAIVAGRFLSRSGDRIAAPRVAALLGHGEPSPDLPPDVAAWAAALDVAHRDPD